MKNSFFRPGPNSFESTVNIALHSYLKENEVRSRLRRHIEDFRSLADIQVSTEGFEFKRVEGTKDHLITNQKLKFETRTFKKILFETPIGPSKFYLFLYYFIYSFFIFCFFFLKTRFVQKMRSNVQVGNVYLAKNVVTVSHNVEMGQMN